MNWGKGIAIALIAFIGFIVYLAVVLMTHNVDLESEDYYLREIAYEEEITALENAMQNEAVKVSQNETHVVFQVPDSSNYEAVEIDLSRPNNNELDKHFKMVDTQMFTVDKSELENGQYNIEITYTSAGKNCLQKDKIYI